MRYKIVKYFDDHYEGIVESNLSGNEAIEKADRLNDSVKHRPYTKYMIKQQLHFSQNKDKQPNE